MAWVKMICKECGKEFDREVAKGNEEFAKEHMTLCPQCYRKECEAIEAGKMERALSGLTLAKLVGSEKQIAWAERLRSNRIKDVKKTCDKAREMFRAVAPERIGEADEIEKKLLAWISGKADAKFFIDTRDEDETKFYETHKAEWDA